MDFFDHQDTARQRTGLLVFLFSLAVLIITSLVSVLSITIYYVVTGEPFDQRTAITYTLLCFAGVALVVAISSMFRLSELSSNGGRVASLKVLEVSLFPQIQRTQNTANCLMW